MLPAIRRSNRGLMDPWDAMEGEFGRMLRQFWGDAENGSLVGAYPVDIREDDDHYYVEAEMPGFRKEDIQVTLENGVLHLVAERKTSEARGTAHVNERRFSRVARSFTIPSAVDEGKVDARLQDGVLHLTLNKREEVKPRRIEVK